MDDFKRQYRIVMDDHFPEELTISFGSQSLRYRKKSWKIADSSGALVEKGLRYGENPGQEAALYELISGIWNWVGPSLSALGLVSLVA